jgi:hypothetical protein
MQVEERYMIVSIKRGYMLSKDGLSLVVFAALAFLFTAYALYPRGTYVECRGQKVEVMEVPGGEIYVTQDGAVLYSC